MHNFLCTFGAVTCWNLAQQCAEFSISAWEGRGVLSYYFSIEITYILQSRASRTTARQAHFASWPNSFTREIFAKWTLNFLVQSSTCIGHALKILVQMQICAKHVNESVYFVPIECPKGYKIWCRLDKNVRKKINCHTMEHLKLY